MEQAKGEFDKSLNYAIYCMRRIGVTFDVPKSKALYWRLKVLFLVSVASICYHMFGEVVHNVITLNNSPTIVDIVPNFHIFGYGILRYFRINVYGIWLYNLSPIGIYFFHLWQGQEAQMGFVWVSWYPFDKHKPVAHVFVNIFEMFIGQTCVWIVVGTDLLFSGIASHICRLLRVLQKRLESLASQDLTDDEYYLEVVENVKLHQRLIGYCNDLEEIFTVSNLCNVLLSCVNICCVLFVIVLIEPSWAVISKLYLGSSLVQIGVLCWYGDDILNANGGVAASAYNSRWYRMNPRCRRALLFLLVRSQKPIAFTAMKFTNISLVTYGSILTKSYSFFALLYTVYRGH